MKAKEQQQLKKELPIRRYMEGLPYKSEWNKTPDEYVSLTTYASKEVVEIGRHENWVDGASPDFMSITGKFTLTQGENKLELADMVLSGQRRNGMSVYVYREHDAGTLEALHTGKENAVFRVVINPEKGKPIVGYMERSLVEEVDGNYRPYYELVKVEGAVLDPKSTVPVEEQMDELTYKKNMVVGEFYRLKTHMVLLANARADRQLPAPLVAMRCSTVAQYL